MATEPCPGVEKGRGIWGEVRPRKFPPSTGQWNTRCDDSQTKGHGTSTARKFTILSACDFLVGANEIAKETGPILFEQEHQNLGERVNSDLSSCL